MGDSGKLHGRELFRMAGGDRFRAAVAGQREQLGEARRPEKRGRALQGVVAADDGGDGGTGELVAHFCKKVGGDERLVGQQDEDAREAKRNHDGEPLRCRLQAFELPAPFEIIARRELHIGDLRLRFGHEGSRIAAFEVHLHDDAPLAILDLMGMKESPSAP